MIQPQSVDVNYALWCLVWSVHVFAWGVRLCMSRSHNGGFSLESVIGKIGAKAEIEKKPEKDRKFHKKKRANSKLSSKLRYRITTWYVEKLTSLQCPTDSLPFQIIVNWKFKNSKFSTWNDFIDQTQYSKYPINFVRLNYSLYQLQYSFLACELCAKKPTKLLSFDACISLDLKVA